MTPAADDDNLDLLLRRADGAAGVPPAVANLAGRVREHYTRRLAQRRRMAGVVATSCLVAAFGVVWSSLSKRPGQLAQPPQPQPDFVAMRTEVVQLRRDADLRLASIDRAVRNAKSPRVAVSARDPLTEIAWQREQAALVLVHQGDRLSRDLKLASTAAVAYRQARDAFPGTRWASVAESRLAGEN
jgi:hypothetical protein